MTNARQMTKHHQTIVAAIVLFLLGAWFTTLQINGARERSPAQNQVTDKPTDSSIHSDDSTGQQTTAESPSATIPFTLTDSNNISIPAILNGTHELNMMLHTAVDDVSLTTDAVAKISDLKMTDSVEIQSWGGKSTSQYSTGNRIKIGDQEFANQTIFIDGFSGKGTDGKFGPRLFGDKIVEIDFDRRLLQLHSDLPPKVLAQNSSFRKLAYTEERGCMYLKGELLVGEKLLTNSFMLHTGFGGTVLLDDQFVSDNDLFSKLETISERELKDSFGNVLKTKKVRLSMLEVGGAKFNDIAVELFDGALGRQKVSVMGSEVLKRFNMIIDAANYTLYLAPNELTNTAFSAL